jgi:hypothetical protein
MKALLPHILSATISIDNLIINFVGSDAKPRYFVNTPKVNCHSLGVEGCENDVLLISVLNSR